MARIRPAKQDDATAIANVHREAVFAKGAAYYDEATMNAWSPGATPDRVTRLEQEISDPDLIVLVAETAKEIVGFALAAPAKNELGALYVKPNPEKGVGRALLAAIENMAFKQAKFLVCDASLNAEAFYKANGYAEECRTEHLLRNGHKIACVRMKKFRPV